MGSEMPFPLVWCLYGERGVLWRSVAFPEEACKVHSEFGAYMRTVATPLLLSQSSITMPPHARRPCVLPSPHASCHGGKANPSSTVALHVLLS